MLAHRRKRTTPRALPTLHKHTQLARVNFIVKLRRMFMLKFQEHRDVFPAACSGESYFIGTVLHSLDHSSFCRHVDKYAFAAAGVSAKFRTLHNIQLSVRFQLSDDLPGVLFHRAFQNSPLKFHREVFDVARRIDPELAALMQTSIVK